MKKSIRVENLDCANCASRLERALNKIDGMNEVSVNFMAQRINIDVVDAKYEKAIEDIKAITAIVLPDCAIKG
ncbi:MAG: heavy metal-associated domain-containing protein [Clostridia bacterium]